MIDADATPELIIDGPPTFAAPPQRAPEYPASHAPPGPRPARPRKCMHAAKAPPRGDPRRVGGPVPHRRGGHRDLPRPGEARPVQALPPWRRARAGRPQRHLDDRHLDPPGRHPRVRLHRRRHAARGDLPRAHRGRATRALVHRARPGRRARPRRRALRRGAVAALGGSGPYTHPTGWFQKSRRCSAFASAWRRPTCALASPVCTSRARPPRLGA